MAVAYVDFEQEEFGVAAALSEDTAMMEAYRKGDPYLEFAKQAGAVPADATKESHHAVRDQFKQCALGVQYGMGAGTLAARLGVTKAKAEEVLRVHQRTYPSYWRWSKEVGRRARVDGRLTATFGWMLNVGPDSNRRSVRNFPLQANGAEILRLACCFLTEKGVRVCAPIHDALLVEAPADDIEDVVEITRQCMRKASEYVLPGFPLRTDTKLVKAPERYMDKRGRVMWQKVSDLIEKTTSVHA
jgi:DNA polymerase I-like protein with 3'-5' exonuclease and polymerase domains